ncbi:hypothetical protein ACHAXR_011579 [Thalassiosira sp. AJA248-18]
MEIHRRTRPSSSAAPNNDKTSASSRRTYGPPIKARPLTENPYNAASSSLTDVILFRSIQLLLCLAFAWFVYLMVAVNSPSLVAEAEGTSSSPSGGSSSSSDGGASLRGQIIPKTAVTAAVDPNDIDAARDQITHLREEFYTRYGGKMASLEMLHRGLRTFENNNDGQNKKEGSAVRLTANRFLSSIVRHEASNTSKQQQPEFVMAFAGYSVTVGRGNHLEQSYPFVLERILSPILELSPFNMKLTVRNSAIGGIPSFPYGWCLSNFLGEDADVVSWDYGMNEGNGASGLESYVRQSLMMPKSPPLFVLLDMKRPRLDLLQKYVNLGVLPDPIALGGRDAVDKKLLQLPEGERPSGLQKWDEWGAPKGAPGQSPWHPKKMEHELMGWMLVVHMLDALDVALEVMEKDINWRNAIIAQEQQRDKKIALPPPITDASNTGVASLLHGSALQSDSSKWHMNHISCRTSFLPNTSGDFNSIVESGVTKDDEDMLQARDDSLFDGGWVMDVGKLERDTKLKVQKYGGLGYIDMKTALYGIPSSGTLKLWIPYEGRTKSTTQPDDNAGASKYFNAVVLCEVNEKRGDKECNMMSDLGFRVGDAAVSKDHVSQVKGVASYLKKDICIRVEIPEEAQISVKGGENHGFGLAVEITVTGAGVSRENGACSISHVIWENQ